VQIAACVPGRIVWEEFKQWSREANGEKTCCIFPWLNYAVHALQLQLYLHAQTTPPATQGMQIQKAVDTYPMQ